MDEAEADETADQAFALPTRRDRRRLLIEA
jgi:hypothetical protein